MAGNSAEAGANPGSDRGRGLRDRLWFQVLVVLLLVFAFTAFIATRTRSQVVQGWDVLATCPADSDAIPSEVTTMLDTYGCATVPSHTVSGRGWPIVPITVPGSAGPDPAITRVLSDRSQRTIDVEYRRPSAPSQSTVPTLVFIEVPESALPPVPFTVKGATGPVTITAVRTG